MLYAVTSNGDDTCEIRILVDWYSTTTCMLIMKNLYPKLKISFTQLLRMLEKEGEIFLYLVEKSITEAINETNIGMAAKVKHKANREGGKNLVSRRIIKNAINCPII